MPLYTVIFTEHGGYRCQCRIRAAAIADHVTLAVQKVWGPAAFWAWEPGSTTVGRVIDRDSARTPEDIPRTGLATVTIQPGTQRRRSQQAGEQAEILPGQRVGEPYAVLRKSAK